MRKSAVISVQATGGLTFVGGRGAQIQCALVGPDLAKLDQYTRGSKLMDDNPSSSTSTAASRASLSCA